MNVLNEDPTKSKLADWFGAGSHVETCVAKLNEARKQQDRAERTLIEHLVPKDAAPNEAFQKLPLNY